MTYLTSNTYQMKREILSFSNKFSKLLPKPERKFMADMTYGGLTSQSCLITDIAHHLHEPYKKSTLLTISQGILLKVFPEMHSKLILLRSGNGAPSSLSSILTTVML